MHAQLVEPAVDPLELVDVHPHPELRRVAELVHVLAQHVEHHDEEQGQRHPPGEEEEEVVGARTAPRRGPAAEHQKHGERDEDAPIGRPYEASMALQNDCRRARSRGTTDCLEALICGARYVLAEQSRHLTRMRSQDCGLVPGAKLRCTIREGVNGIGVEHQRAVGSQRDLPDELPRLLVISKSWADCQCLFSNHRLRDLGSGAPRQLSIRGLRQRNRHGLSAAAVDPRQNRGRCGGGHQSGAAAQGSSSH